jgi:hypothetical protein
MYCAVLLSSNGTELPCSATSQGLGERDEDTNLETENVIICCQVTEVTPLPGISQKSTEVEPDALQ